MTARYVVTQAQLREALASAKERLPAYREMLGFYEQVFLAQEASKNETAPPPYEPAPGVLSAKLKGGFPLVSLSEFPVDVAAAVKLFSTLLSIAKKTPGKWAEFAQALSAQEGPVLPEPALLFEKFLSQEDAYFEAVAKRHGADARMLGFLAYHSLVPSLVLSSEQLAVHLKGRPDWEKGYCPICGSPPGLAVLEEEGVRFFFCSFCLYKWKTRRLFCPHCENTDGAGLHYFFSEKETGYRVHGCDRCGKYLKSVDLREIAHPVYPLLELLTTLHLDMHARQAGYESPVCLPAE